MTQTILTNGKQARGAHTLLPDGMLFMAGVIQAYCTLQQWYPLSLLCRTAQICKYPASVVFSVHSPRYLTAAVGLATVKLAGCAR